MSSSTLRFFARPASVVLGATGASKQTHTFGLQPIRIDVLAGDQRFHNSSRPPTPKIHVELVSANIVGVAND